MIDLHDYEARIAQAVRDNLDAEVMKTVLTESTSRPGYWERIYNVAWRKMDEAGTHRVCINSEGESMCVWGHYMMTDNGALADLKARS